MRLFPLAGLLALSTLGLHAQNAAPEKADPKQLPGHSMHGEAFNEGPRQAAVLMAGTGQVDFPVTTTNPEAQRFFTQGIGQLHGFWYFEAERSFRQAAALDPECAMAYCGMAMANVNNEKRAAEFMKVATAKKAKASRREQLWVDAYAAYFAPGKGTEETRRSGLVKALEDLSFEFPTDLEAKAFLVFQLWDNKQHKMPLPSRQAVDALAKQVLAVNPMHPVHHYLIHLWNNAEGDKRAIDAAAHCGQAAPGIAHMWHMSGHTFSNLRRYPEATWQQEASARVDHASMAAARIMPEQIHNYAHNNDWLVKNLIYVGRVHDALDLAKNMIELPRLGPNKSKAYNMGRERLLEALLRFELWNDLLALENTMYLAPAEVAADDARRLATLGTAYFRTGKLDGGKQKLAALEKVLTGARTARVAAADEAEKKAQTEKKTEEQITQAMASAMRGQSFKIKNLEAAIAEVQIEQALAEKKLAAVKPLLEKARDLSSDRRARIQLAIGNPTEALKLAREASNADSAQVQPLANLADVLWQTGDKKAAIENFQKLRKLSAALDLDTPVFQRLAPIIADLKLPTDWRLPATVAPDAGVRPEIASLGPFRWQPYTAPSWTLPNSQKSPVSLAEFRGRPVLVIFYLGSGCSHCIEQLNVFSPMTKDFAAAGIPMVAVSTDSPDGLHKTLEQAKNEGGFFFPIVSDPSLATFKAYRAYDDFERIPLHGTFLIDGEGRVRWQDIGFKPFSEAKWLLGEAQRLLSVPMAEPHLTTRTVAPEKP